MLHGFTVDTNLPAGNAVIDGIDGDRVKLHQDLRDSSTWFYWRLPKSFSPSNPDGIRPVSTYLKVIGDICRWGDRIVFGCDDQTKDEFLGKRGLKKDAPPCGRSLLPTNR